MSDVRADLKEVESEISRLLEIGKAFQSKDRDWSDYKNKEDWGRNIPQIKDWTSPAFVDKFQLPVRSCSNACGLSWSK
jgi:hypothetical protein